MARKIMEKIPEGQLQNDLEKYRERALELGATDAKVIPTDAVVIDERVLAKCTYPKCPGYGTNANCPRMPWIQSKQEKWSKSSGTRYLSSLK